MSQLYKKEGEVLTIEEVRKIWLKHKNLHVEDNDENLTAELLKLHQSGVSIRALATVSGISKSTLSYRFKKEVKSNE